MICKINHRGILVFVERDNFVDNHVVVQRGVVIVRYGPFHLFRQERIIPPDAVNCEMNEPRFVWIPLFGIHVLSPEMEHDELGSMLLACLSGLERIYQVLIVSFYLIIRFRKDEFELLIVDVFVYSEFEDGTIVKNKQLSSFRRGQIKHPDKWENFI